MSGLSERVRILQTRDKSLRENRERHTDIETATAVVGTCPDMCPEFERYFREETNQLSPLEISADGKPDYHAMVKEYRRAGADQSEPLPHELRPGTVLNRTFDYLVCNVMDRPDRDPAITGEWYDFLWSRTRAIRKDITQQHFCDQTSVSLLEKCARFHIHCAAVLVEEDAAVFDSKINDENLSKCIQSLKDFYQDLSLQGITCANEAEFRSYDILLNLSDSDILREIKHLRREIRDSNEVRFVVSAHFAMTSNNFPLFFKLVRQANYLQACLMHRYFTQVRVNAIKLLRKSYTIPNQTETYPLDLLSNLLGFDDLNQLKVFLEQVDVEYNESENCVLLTRSRTFEAPPLPAPTRSGLVEAKKMQSLGEIVHGGQLPPNPYKKFPLHSSFDLKGALKPDARTAADQQKTSDFLKSEESHLQASSSEETPVFRFFQPPSTSIESTGGFSFLQTHKLQAQDTKKQEQEAREQQEKLQNLQNMERKQQLISNFCQEQVDNMINLVVDEHIRSFANVLMKSVKREKVVSLVAGSFIDSTLNSFILETASLVHRNAKEQQLIKLKQEKLDQVALIVERDIFDQFISSFILGVAQTVHQEALRRYISLNSGHLSRKLISDLTDKMIFQVSSEAFNAAIVERENLVNKMRLCRSMRLASNSFKHWFSLYKRSKHRRHIRQTFPASSVENSIEIIVSPSIRRSSMKRPSSAIDTESNVQPKRHSVLSTSSFSSPKCVNLTSTDPLELSLADEIELTDKNDIMSQLKLLKAKIGEVKRETSETKKTIDLLEKSFHFVDQADSP